MDMYKERKEDFEKNGPSHRNFVWGRILTIHGLPFGECTEKGGGVQIVHSDGSKLDNKPSFHPYVRKDGKWKDCSVSAPNMEAAIILAIAYLNGDVNAAQYACRVLKVPIE